MATQIASLHGDSSDIVDQDFTKLYVRLRANTDVVVDPDNDKIRVLDPRWFPAAPDGTFSFAGIIAAADTVVPGTLQYYLDVRAKGDGADQTSTIGPFVLVAGDQDITDVDIVPAVDFNSTTPISIDEDVLAEAQAYTDDSFAAHEADPDPHPQYIRVLDSVSGLYVEVPFMRALEADPMPAVVQGAYLAKGGF